METYTLFDIDYVNYTENKFVVGVFDSKEKAEDAKKQIEDAFSNGNYGRYASCNLRIEKSA